METFYFGEPPKLLYGVYHPAREFNGRGVEAVRANHNFTLPRSQRELIELILSWLDLAFRNPRAESV